MVIVTAPVAVATPEPAGSRNIAEMYSTNGTTATPLFVCKDTLSARVKGLQRLNM